MSVRTMTDTVLRHSRIFHATFCNNVVDLLDQEDCHERDAGNGNDDGNNAFSKCQFFLVQVLVPISILVVISMKGSLVETMMGPQLEKDETVTILLVTTTEAWGPCSTYMR
jgi:hypothetical protein